MKHSLQRSMAHAATAQRTPPRLTPAQRQQLDDATVNYLESLTEAERRRFMRAVAQYGAALDSGTPGRIAAAQRELMAAVGLR